MGWLPPEPGATHEHGRQAVPEHEHREALGSVEPLEPLEGWARVATWLLAACAVMSVLSMLTEIDLHSFLVDVSKGVPRTLADAKTIDDRRQVISIIQVLLLLATGIAFIGWFRRAYRNLPGLGYRDLRFVRGWAVWSWFVPILNLWRPKQMANDIWRGSGGQEPDYPTGRVGGRPWTAAPVPALLHWWWALWLIGGFTGSRATRMLYGADTLADKISAATVSSVDNALSAIAAILAILVIRAITARQDAAIAGRRRIGAPAAVLGDAAL